MLHNCTLHFVRLFHLKSFEKQEKEEKRAREQTEPDFYGFFVSLLMQMLEFFHARN